MIQINYNDLPRDAQYMQHVYERFAADFPAVQDEDLRTALAAYCFWLAVPLYTFNLSKDNIHVLQLLNMRQYNYAVLSKKLALFPRVLELANALSDVISKQSTPLDNSVYSIPSLADAFELLPADIQARYRLESIPY